MEKKFIIFTSIVTIVSGVIGIISLIKTNPILAYISFSVLLISVLILFLSNYIYAQFIIKSAIKRLIQRLNSLNYKPDVIISFTRSGSIAAGAIAINLNLQRVIVIPRILKDHNSRISYENRFLFEDILNLNPQYFKDKKILVVAFSMFTSETIKSGIEYLDNKDIKPADIKVASLFVSEGALRAFPDLLYSYISNQPDKYFNYIPWLLDKYPLV